MSGVNIKKDYPWLLGPIAHRGLLGPGLVENTLPGFARCAEHRCPMELDVHLSRDGVPMVFHDDDLKRMFSRPERPEDLTAEELKSLTLPGGFRIPTLSEVFAVVNGAVGILIELKQANGKMVGPLEEILAGMVKDYGGPVAVESFNPLSVRYAKRYMPHVPSGLLSGWDFSAPPNWFYDLVARNLWHMFLAKADFIAYEYKDVDRKKLQNYRKKGMPILAYTIMDEAAEKKTAPYVDGFIFQDYYAI